MRQQMKKQKLKHRQMLNKPSIIIIISKKETGQDSVSFYVNLLQGLQLTADYLYVYYSYKAHEVC